MFSFKYHIYEEAKPVEPHTLHAFDMDETLVTHDHGKLRVHVMDDTGNRVRTLSNQEYNTHKLLHGHKYDFSEFTNSDLFAKHSKPIRKMITKLNHIVKNKGNAEIVTARADLDDKDKFAHHMKKYGIDIKKNVHVSRAGNLKGKIPENKAKIISELIHKHGYGRVHFYDDAPENLDKFLKLKKNHPQVELHAHHVQHDPITGDVSINTKSVIPKPLGLKS